jgi:flagellin
MAFSINTNIASLQAQEYLRITGEFQHKTINRVTSGLRIISSGDDAAGLAIANGFRSDRAVLSQGVRNANDGLSTLQTIDGGINNISQLLDRARTLATQSASGTFSGDRSVLNSEFKSVLEEINRQAQSIGLNEGGTFAKNLSVFIGGGRSSGSVDAIRNGSVSVDLSRSLVDAKNLGLQTYQTAADGDLRSGSATSIAAIKAANASQTADFVFFGAGFSGGVTVSVDISAVNDEKSLVEAINNAINSVESVSSAGQAFKNAGIQAAMSEDGKSLVFASGSSAFQVRGATALGAALLGSFGTGAAGSTTSATNYKEAGGVTGVVNLSYAALSDTETQLITVSTRDANGSLVTAEITLTGDSDGLDVNEAVAYINSQLQLNSGSPLAKIVAVADGANGGRISFISTLDQFQVTVGESSAATEGVNDGAAATYGSAVQGQGGLLSIADVASAETAVNALASAVQKLGAAQAVVGKGQNQLTFAISLAQTQLTNITASESRIRDADLAAEAANLTRVQILQQAGIAALAQANAAPQAVLSLLRV